MSYAKLFSVFVLFLLVALSRQAIATSGYKDSAGVDLSDLFEPGNSGVVTGYKSSSGVDLGAMFLGAAEGSPGSATGYKLANGTDIGTLFCAKGTKRATSTTLWECQCGGGSVGFPTDFTLTDLTTGKVYTSDSSVGRYCIDSTGVDAALKAGHSYKLVPAGTVWYDGYIKVYRNGVTFDATTPAGPSITFTCDDPNLWRVEDEGC